MRVPATTLQRGRCDTRFSNYFIFYFLSSAFFPCIIYGLSFANFGRLQHVCGTMILTFKIHQERSVHLVAELRSDEILLGQAEDHQGRLAKAGNVCAIVYVCHAPAWIICFVAGWASQCLSPWGPQALLRPFYDAVLSRTSRSHTFSYLTDCLHLIYQASQTRTQWPVVHELIDLGYCNCSLPSNVSLQLFFTDQ